ncbi:hypothetical protein P3T26_003593 [Streptomyces sp. MAA16]|nr:hypothetical protein [Streptomyces sp. MAA16]
MSLWAAVLWSVARSATAAMVVEGVLAPGCRGSGRGGRRRGRARPRTGPSGSHTVRVGAPPSGCQGFLARALVSVRAPGPWVMALLMTASSSRGACGGTESGVGAWPPGRCRRSGRRTSSTRLPASVGGPFGGGDVVVGLDPHSAGRLGLGGRRRGGFRSEGSRTSLIREGAVEAVGGRWALADASAVAPLSGRACWERTCAAPSVGVAGRPISGPCSGRGGCRVVGVPIAVGNVLHMPNTGETASLLAGHLRQRRSVCQ